MTDSDQALLQSYASHRDEAAFRALANRHLGLVFHTALRRTHNRQIGKWINATPAGPTKTTSIRAYAETLSRYGQPAAAAQWAMTLPLGKDLDETLKQIHNNRPKNDPAAKEAAAAFAKEHGIK